MKYVLLILVSFLFGCGKAYQSAEFAPYLESFSNIYDKDVSNITIYFDNLPNKTVGICYYKDKEIRIDKTFWDQSTTYGREELIFHELGHCVLRLDHNDDMIEDPSNSYMAMPVSIMYSKVFGNTKSYINNRDYYLQELVK